MNQIQCNSSRRQPSADDLAALRKRCQGILPLDGRLAAWMSGLFVNYGQQLNNWVEQFGSPVNVIHTTPLLRNIQQLVDVAASHSIDFRVYFARKANKCLAFVKSAVLAGSGIDVASEQECLQVLQCGAEGDDLVCTAAVKSKALVELCVRRRVTVVIDNWHEFACVVDHARRLDMRAVVAVRVGGFWHQNERLDSRFGFDVDEVPTIVRKISNPEFSANVDIRGLHFHLDGYSASQRVAAIEQSVGLIELMRDQGNRASFLDIGGGIPMCYLEHESQWNDFWSVHLDAVLGRHAPLTYRGHGLGFTASNGVLLGSPNVYPYFQSPVQEQWLNQILSAKLKTGDTVAATLRDRNIQLRCEPGRSVLDGCGMTMARVEFVKRNRHGDHFIGLLMNRTQCRTSSDDYLVDPILIPAIDRRLEEIDQPIEGFLVGAYCTESELLSLRKLKFRLGVQPGDLIVFPNTAGYLMHFLESRSHQFPLARNIVFQSMGNGMPNLDAIEHLSS